MRCYDRDSSYFDDSARAKDIAELPTNLMHRLLTSRDLECTPDSMLLVLFATNLITFPPS